MAAFVPRSRSGASPDDPDGIGLTATLAAPDLVTLLECPACHGGGLAASQTGLSCGHCGEGFPIENGIACFQRTFDDYSENYDQISADDLVEPKTPSIVKEVLTRLINDRAQGVVCDLGCGDGYVIKRIPSERRIAIDIARGYLETLPQDILRIWSRVENVPLAQGSLDTIICTDVLEHVLDAQTLAREIDRLCATNGRVLLACPFEQDLSVYDLPEYKGKYGKYKFVHLRSINDATITRLFPGFRVRAERLITEGMALMEFKPFPIKFFDLLRRA